MIKKWQQHIQIVKEYINSPKNMDPEQILRDIRSPKNTNLMIQLNKNNLSNIDMFIPLLTVIYKNFTLDDDSEDSEDSDESSNNNNNNNNNNNDDMVNMINIENMNISDMNLNDNDNDDKQHFDDEKSDDEKYNIKSEASIEDYHHDEEEEDDDNVSFEYFVNINKRSDYDKLICNGSCGNTLSDYIYSIKESINCKSKNKLTLGPDDKLSTIARCFISYDYELRIELVSLIDKYYYIEMNNKSNNIIIDEMLNALKNEDECFEIDKKTESDTLKWVKKFDLLFKEFIKTNKSFILDELSLKACRRALNLSLIEEFQQNSSKLRIELKTNIFPIKKTLIYKTLNQNGKELKSNELIALYAFIKYQNEFFKEKINSCKWKQFYTNLTSAIKKLHDGLSIESTKFPTKLYCYTNQLEKDKNTLTLNSITYWTTNKSLKRLSGGTLLELNDVKEFLFHHNKNKCSIIGVPVHWIIDNNNNNNIDQWMLMPFIASSTDRMEKKGYEALFNIDKNNTNSFIIMNSKYWG